MRHVKLKTNIGTADARRLRLDRTRTGETVEVEDRDADAMVARGWAEIIDDGDGLAETPDVGEPTPDITAGPADVAQLDGANGLEGGLGDIDGAVGPFDDEPDDEPTGEDGLDADQSPKRRRGRPKKLQG